MMATTIVLARMLIADRMIPAHPKGLCLRVFFVCSSVQPLYEQEDSSKSEQHDKSQILPIPLQGSRSSLYVLPSIGCVEGWVAIHYTRSVANYIAHVGSRVEEIVQAKIFASIHVLEASGWHDG